MGADYRRGYEEFLISLGNYDVMGANLTQYFGQTGVLYAAVLDATFLASLGMDLTRMNVHLDGAPGGADTVQVTLMRDGVVTPLNVVITGAAIAAGITATSVIAAGQRLAIRLISSATAQNIRANVSFRARGTR